MTGAGGQVNLGLRLLDDQLFDAKEHRCGRVDDIQLEGGPGVRTEISALLTGSAAWRRRLRRPFGAVVAALAPGYVHCIPWTEVSGVETAVNLAKTAKELGLESDEGHNVQWMGALPRGTLLVSELLGSRLVGSSGRDLGRVWDVRAERETELPDEHVNEPWRIVGLIAGRSGWKERIGLSPEGEAAHGPGFVTWESVQQVADGRVVVGTT